VDVQIVFVRIEATSLSKAFILSKGGGKWRATAKVLTKDCQFSIRSIETCLNDIALFDSA